MLLIGFIAGTIILICLLGYTWFRWRRISFRYKSLVDFIVSLPFADQLCEMEPAEFIREFESRFEGDQQKSVYYFWELEIYGRLLALIEAVGYWRDRSSTDYLTKLLNRKGLNEAFAHEHNRFLRLSNSHISIVMIDIDHFKMVNDTYGHEMGDRVLYQVARCFEKSFRITDYVGRWGGEEFLIILPDTNLEGAMKVAEMARLRLARQKVEYDGKTVQVTISAGVTSIEKNGIPERAIYLVDQALYKAKNHGRNQCWGYSGGEFFCVQLDEKEYKSMCLEDWEEERLKSDDSFDSVKSRK